MSQVQANTTFNTMFNEMSIQDTVTNNKRTREDFKGWEDRVVKVHDSRTDQDLIARDIHDAILREDRKDREDRDRKNREDREDRDQKEYSDWYYAQVAEDVDEDTKEEDMRVQNEVIGELQRAGELQEVLANIGLVDKDDLYWEQEQEYLEYLAHKWSDF